MSTIAFRWGATSWTVLASYQTGSGQDASSKRLDPAFVSVGIGDYSLSATSPAVNMCPSLGYTSDLAGNPVPLGTVDAGAYERQ